MPKARVVYVCKECGYESAKWLGKCPACNEWNSFFEQKLEEKIVQNKRENKENTEPVALRTIESKAIVRMSTGFAELDRVLRWRISRWITYLAWWRASELGSLPLYFKYATKLRQMTQYFTYQERNLQSK